MHSIKRIREFVAKLKATGIKFEIVKGQISWEPTKIRATISGKSYCPITALAHAENGYKYNVGQWDDAADFLGLDPDDALAIIGAADGDFPSSRAVRRELESLVQAEKEVPDAGTGK